MGNDDLKVYAPGEVICREGSTGREAYLIHSGRVRVTRRNGTEDTILAELGPNELVGEFSIIDQEPRSATVTAIVETKVAIINAGRLALIFERSPEVAATIVRLLVHKLREANRIKSGEVSPTDWKFWRRTIYLLLLLAAVGNDDADEVHLPAEETRDNLAIGLGAEAGQAANICNRLVQAEVLAFNPSPQGAQVFSLRMSDLNMMYHYIEQTYSPGLAEPKTSMDAETRSVASCLLSLCRKHYGDLSMALSTFRKNALIDFIASGGVYAEHSADMRKRLISQALDRLFQMDYIHNHEGQSDVWSIDLDTLAARVDDDEYLTYCRKRYEVLCQPWQALPSVI